MTEETQPDIPPPRRWRRLLCWLTVVAAVTSPCWGLPLFCVSVPAILEWTHRIPFDSAAWKATDDPSVRYDMSWDLVHGDVLKGKTGSEVEEMLGKPMMTETLGRAGLPMFSVDHFEPGLHIWYYDLGGEKYEMDFGPSGAVLAVDFKDGKVVRARKVVH